MVARTWSPRPGNRSGINQPSLLRDASGQSHSAVRNLTAPRFSDCPQLSLPTAIQLANCRSLPTVYSSLTVYSLLTALQLANCLTACQLPYSLPTASQLANCPTTCQLPHT